MNASHKCDVSRDLTGQMPDKQQIRGLYFASCQIEYGINQNLTHEKLPVGWGFQHVTGNLSNLWISYFMQEKHIEQVCKTGLLTCDRRTRQSQDSYNLLRRSESVENMVIILSIT